MDISTTLGYYIANGLVVHNSNNLLAHGYTVFHRFDEYEEITDKEGNPVIDDKTGKAIKTGIITVWDDMDAWEKVLASFVFRPRDFTDLLRGALKSNQRLSWVGWDDINIHLPRSMYFTQRRLWETLAKNWEGMRANMNIFECSAPRKDRVASFILGDMNWEALCSNQERVAVRRWFWESDYYEPEKVNKYRIDVSDRPTIMEHVPREIWDRYWARKIPLIDEATGGMIEVLDQMDKPEPEKKKDRPEVAELKETRARLDI